MVGMPIGDTYGLPKVVEERVFKAKVNRFLDESRSGWQTLHQLVEIIKKNIPLNQSIYYLKNS